FGMDYVYLSLCLKMQDRTDWEIPLEKARRLDGRSMLITLIDAKLIIDDLDSIFDLINEFHTKNNDPKHQYSFEAKVYSQQKQYSEAIESYEALYELVPRNFRGLFDLAECYKEIGDTEGLEKTRTRILAIEGLPENKIQEAQDL
ncbi:MAG: tetratricopeptide repeat protein, partial [Anaerolineales bacterium]